MHLAPRPLPLVLCSFFTNKFSCAMRQTILPRPVVGRTPNPALCVSSVQFASDGRAYFNENPATRTNKFWWHTDTPADRQKTLLLTPALDWIFNFGNQW